MRTVGKIAVLAMTLALAGVLTACGGSGSASSAASSASSAAENSAAAAASSESASVEAAAASAAAEGKAAESADAEQAGADAWNNEMFGFKFEKPEGWVFATEDEIASRNQSNPAGPNSEIVMMALSPDKSTMVEVSIDESGTDATPDAHLDARVETMKKTIDAQTNGNDEFSVDNVTFGFTSGDSLPARMITAKAGDTTLYGFLDSAQKDGAFFDVSIQGHDKEAVSTVASCFKEVK